jgi:hypothetical protein
MTNICVLAVILVIVFTDNVQSFQRMNTNRVQTRLAAKQQAVKGAKLALKIKKITLIIIFSSAYLIETIESFRRVKK